MTELSFTHRNLDGTGSINEPCPYGVHYEGETSVFRIGSSACKEKCPYSLLDGVRPHSRKHTVLCTADEAETVFKSVSAD